MEKLCRLPSFVAACEFASMSRQSACTFADRLMWILNPGGFVVSRRTGTSTDPFGR
jgi:hypothetical protein